MGAAFGAGVRPPPELAGPTSIHQDIARDVGQQVEMMILNAKHQSETKVSQEIQRIKQKMDAMAEKIKRVSDRLSRLDTSGAIHKSDLQKSIAKLEEVWEGEVGTLKHELWQTIQAHNHNADLMKHHKDAIDQIQGRIAEAGRSPELEQIHEQLLQVDKVMQREQAKQQQIDQLMQRLTLVQQQLAGGIPPWGAGMPYPLPGAAPVPPGMQAAGRKVQKKSTKAPKQTKPPGAGNAAPSLRAEAPEFVPTTAGWSGDAAP